MKICAISDSHSYHRDLVIPEADVLLHAGDITWKGELSILGDFSNWLKDIPIKHKIIVCGNHELGIEHGNKRQPALAMFADAGAIYLEDSGVEIDGIKFWGSPVSPFFHDWEWNRHRGKDISVHWDKIPDDTNVLITHSPPYGIGDMTIAGDNVGCEDLTRRINHLPNLKLHVFGHIHPGYGLKKVGDIYFANASVCTNKYDPTNPPIVVEI